MGGIFFYVYLFFAVITFLEIPFSLSVESESFWFAICLMGLWFLTCQLGFNLVDRMNWSLASEHCSNHIQRRQ